MLRVIICFLCGYLCGSSLILSIINGGIYLTVNVCLTVAVMFCLIFWADRRHKRKQKEFYKDRFFKVSDTCDKFSLTE